MQSLVLQSRSRLMLLPLSLAVGLTLTACGSDSNNNGAVTNGAVGSGHTQQKPAVKDFSGETVKWKIDIPESQNAVACYDFDSKTAVSCTDNKKWDVKFERKNREVSLFTNGGASGDGQGAAFGLENWKTLKTYQNPLKDPVTNTDISKLYEEDSTGGIFFHEPWYEYNLKGNHYIYPNHRVYLITLNSDNPTIYSSVQAPVYALQIINYYDKAGKSGFPTIRYIDVAIPSDVKTETIDASSWDNKWTYFNLKTGKTVDNEQAEWHIAFNRYKVKLNGGASGNGKVGASVQQKPKGFYSKNKPVVEKFEKDNADETLKYLTNPKKYFSEWKKEARWTKDRVISVLTPSPNGFDFGWYDYKFGSHRLVVKPEDKEKGALIRSAEGNSYARMRLSEINYADEKSRNQTSWVFEFDVQ